ncbi:MAG: hypothetical protein K2L80_07955 [Muribaculaceae bacterium]|nr:hypothetical protein [Muribaculaceae bacterium]MDE6332521.1 hypothetical protein [Muribaculaceae bacterium]
MENERNPIELRSKKLQTVMRRIPRSLLWWNAAVITIISAALLTACFLI